MRTQCAQSRQQTHTQNIARCSTNEPRFLNLARHDELVQHEIRLATDKHDRLFVRARACECCHTHIHTHSKRPHLLKVKHDVELAHAAKVQVHDDAVAVNRFECNEFVVVFVETEQKVQTRVTVQRQARVARRANKTNAPVESRFFTDAVEPTTTRREQPTTANTTK